MMVQVYEEKMTKLCLGGFDISSVNGVALWIISPDWSRWGRPGDASIAEEWGLTRNAYDRSITGGVMILWLPVSRVHEYPFHPDECDPWTCCGTIISGSDPLYIGYVYRKGKPLDWNLRVIRDSRGRRASSSSKTVKFMLEEFVAEGQKVVEPYAHSRAILPIWCRMQAISYLGFTSSPQTYGRIVKELAQVELPGIQLALPSTYG
jgi:hypothetical protein